MRIFFALVFLTGALPGFSGELLENPDFKKDLKGWRVHRTTEYRETRMPEPGVVKGKKGEKPFFSIDMPYPTGPWYVQLNQEVEVEAGTIYDLKFDVRANQPDVQVAVALTQMIDLKAFINGLAVRVTPQTEWKRQAVVFKVPEVKPGVPVGFHVGFGLCTGVVEVRDFSLTEAADQSVTVKRNHGDLLSDGGGAIAANGPETGAAPGIGQPRTWTSVSGSTMEGQFVSYSGGMVTLRISATGKEVRIPMLKLIPADRALIKAQSARP